MKHTTQKDIKSDTHSPIAVLDLIYGMRNNILESWRNTSKRWDTIDHSTSMEYLNDSGIFEVSIEISKDTFLYYLNKQVPVKSLKLDEITVYLEFLHENYDQSTDESEYAIGLRTYTNSDYLLTYGKEWFCLKLL